VKEAKSLKSVEAKTPAVYNKKRWCLKIGAANYLK
jgi:hypothetical protein